MSLKKSFLVLVCSCAFFSFQQLSAQLSDLHYLPPLKLAVDNNIFNNQRIYLSTPELTAFDVVIYQGTNSTPLATVSVSNAAPATYDLPGNSNDITMVSAPNTGIVLQNSGLRFESLNGELFYVSFRGNSTPQGETLTSKGRTALGTNFRWGSIPTIDTSSSSNDHNSVMGVMATEDNTTVTISGYDAGCTFRLGADIDGITDDALTITLNANETFVLEAPMLGNTINRTGTIGSSIVSDKPIALSNGNLMVNRIQGVNNQDAGIDQAVPIDRLGREYVFMRGRGADEKELPLIIATANNTRVFINDASTPNATLNRGEYFLIDGSNYSGNSPGDNMYVRASKNAYAYQLTAGDDGFPNLGMNFISPVSCLMPREVNNIALINELPSTTVTGGITLLASTSTPDANIVVTDGNGTVALPAPNSVSGTSEWKTFYIPGLTGNVSVNSSGPISVGYIGFNGAIGTASYFSGFDDVPVVEYTFGDGITPGCLGDPIEVVDIYDAYQWYRNDELIVGATEPNFTPTEIGEYYVEVVSGVVEGEACSFESNSIDVFYCEPEIVLNKTVDQEQVDVGDTVTFTITVQSLGIDEVTNLNIEDSLPEGLTLIDAVPTKGTWSDPNWSVDTLFAGELQSIVIRATVDGVPVNSDSNVLVNTAINTQDQTDNNIVEDDPTAFVIVGNDSDNDGIDNDIDLDDDNDGTLDVDETNGDDDGDGIINSIDLDSDNDGISDLVEAGGEDADGNGRVDNFIDDNNDGFFDNLVVDPLEDLDSDGDGVVNRLDLDSDDDGITDTTEAGGIDVDADGSIDDTSDTNNNGISDSVEGNLLPDEDNDSDGLINRLDIDSDDDGIPDNIEAQPTFEYIVPSGVSGINGIDINYTQGFTPIDTDDDGTPDYLDTDSDNDGSDDSIEGGQGSFIGTDTDNDGLDDGFEGDDLNDPENVNNGIEDPSSLPDEENPGGDVDFRDDGIPDEPELDCNPNTGLDANGDPCVFIDNESVGPQVDEGFFRINNIDFFPENTFKVFNRWGVLVYETNSYNSGSNNFTGISTGRATINKDDQLPSGVYHYILEYTAIGKNNTFSGYLYLIQ